MVLFIFLFSFVISFLLGQLGSLILYQATWKNGIGRQFHPWGALATFLSKPSPWIFHIPIIILSVNLNWQDFPKLHIFIFVTAGALSLAAVGRWGAVDLSRFFIFDRCLIVILWLGLWLSPIFLYPLLLTCCCLQYIVSGSPLNPGYSNLLGFEFIRNSLCLCLTALLVQISFQLLGVEGVQLIVIDDHVLALVLFGQAAGFFQQAVAKCALGKRWYSWILENRLQCLIVNSYLRGWGAKWIRVKWILMFAKGISLVRVFLCSAAWIIEFSWILILFDPRLTLAILIVTTVFHLVIWLLTGLAGYHYMVSHILMIILVALPFNTTWFKMEYAIVGGFCMIIFSIWVLILRRNLFREFTIKGNAKRWGGLADPANHLMAWWDSPYMRLYSYKVKTTSGRIYCFPVTRFSPYDTFLTDIHTQLMILGLDWELDTQLDADRAIARTGVWGMTVSLEDRNRLYQLMDDPHENLFLRLNGKASSRQNISIKNNDGTRIPGAAHASLVSFFQGLNRYQSKWWFRVLLFWPHFPGEDMVPDWSPLASEQPPSYRGSEPITEVAIYCVKTFYRGDSIQLVDEQMFARLLFPTFLKESSI